MSKYDAYRDAILNHIGTHGRCDAGLARELDLPLKGLACHWHTYLKPTTDGQRAQNEYTQSLHRNALTTRKPAIQDILDLPQSLVSNHLAVLRRNGLVESRRDAEDARWIFYRASPQATTDARERLGALLEVRSAPGDRRRAEQVCRLRGR